MYTVTCIVNNGIGQDAFCKANYHPNYEKALAAGEALWEHQNTCRQLYPEVRERIKSVAVWITNRKGNVVWNREFSSPN